MCRGKCGVWCGCALVPRGVPWIWIWDLVVRVSGVCMMVEEGLWVGIVFANSLMLREEEV